jgi:hypothetical protein
VACRKSESTIFKTIMPVVQGRIYPRLTRLLVRAMIARKLSHIQPMSSKRFQLVLNGNGNLFFLLLEMMSTRLHQGRLSD